MLLALLCMFCECRRGSRRRRSRNDDGQFYVRHIKSPYTADELLRPDRAYFRDLDDTEKDHLLSVDMIKGMRKLVKAQRDNDIVVRRYKDAYRRFLRKTRELLWEREQNLIRRQHAQKRYFSEVAKVANPRASTIDMIGGGN